MATTSGTAAAAAGGGGGDGEPFVEVDPSGRFGRYQELLGAGSTKKVYRAFDQQQGREVAWNQVCLRKFMDNNHTIQSLQNEVQLLKNIRNKNTISIVANWTDKEGCKLNFITDMCTSGNLREYRRKHSRVSIKAIKKWARQILRGLEYLHKCQPCIMHRDLNCSNIFICGYSGVVKIGDFGCAREVGGDVGPDHLAHSMVGTPEYMAPELFEENYTEAVDIYSFGMCLLELVTMEIPYTECKTFLQIYNSVTSGVKPKAMDKVRNLEVRAFIEKCLVKQSDRPSATELLRDAFFNGLD
ncbi:putative serine/threonine-protein kinase wnk11 [Turnera subulata]|uniref:non-specific serine/threonine protein kinase n=1 Tax=Turnera subulata TaxID=218843 RepID=A0A9Q0FGJ2_9ROSI|nr:putative serine/threonine-protein kinase wnk11 [Turnera subulata]